MTDPLLRNVPPNDPEAQRAVLGACMRWPEAYEEAAARLQDEDWYGGAHATVWTAIRRLRERGQPVDALTVRAQLLDLGTLQSAGGEAALAELSECMGSPANVGYYARRVAELAQKRELIRAGAEIVQLGFDSLSAEETQAAAEAKLARATRRAPFRRAFAYDTASGVLERYERVKAGGVPPGYMTGLAAIDELVQGFKPGAYSGVGARTSVGKTTFALNLVDRLASQSLRCGIVSLEMSEEDLLTNLAACRAGISGHRLRSGTLLPGEEQRLEAAIVDMSKLPIVIDDAPGCPASQIISRVRSMAVRGFVGRTDQDWKGCHLVVLDYLQHVNVEDDRKRHAEIGRISQQLKQIARETGTHVMAILQLKPEGERESDDRQPTLGDIRDSGQIAMDLDLCMLLSRPSYGGDASADPKLCVVRVAKHRNGPTGRAYLDFDRACSRFEDRVEPVEDPKPKGKRKRFKGKNKAAEAGEDQE